jgi:Ca2+-binding RTX toxin-like protein
VQISYTQPLNSQAINYIQDLAGNAAASFANRHADTLITATTTSLATEYKELILKGFENINGTGNNLDNTMTGNSASNILDGGAGADSMAGGQGDDNYIVDNVGDIVIEEFEAGIDTVLSSIAYTLDDNVENLILTGTAANHGIGNFLNNKITGNNNNNVLDGRFGADGMAGGLGDDNYIVDDAGDVVIEESGAGTDTVQSSISHILGTNLENLVLTGDKGINGTGNSLDNNITGNKADNIIDGSDGIDVLTGLGGADTFCFFNKQAFGSTTADKITDFDGNDRINISKSAFGIQETNTTFKSVNSASELASALKTDTTFVYDKTLGNLYLNQMGGSNGSSNSASRKSFGRFYLLQNNRQNSIGQSAGIFAVIENQFELTSQHLNLI